jgi:protein-tyrosine-phosphatase/DNA-binding HxlR family transcriptional regulator
VNRAFSVEQRAKVHAALGEPSRLAIVDALAVSDRAPQELQQRFDVPSNLLAHHLDVLEEAGLIERSRSSGDGRRRYVHLRPGALDHLVSHGAVVAQRALFVCTGNSARSQLAAALWEVLTDTAAESAGTHPAVRVHPGAVAAGRRAGVDLTNATPRSLDGVATQPALAITVCDRAHEELDTKSSWLHWSVPDPVPTGTAAAFDRALADLRRRIAAVLGPPVDAAGAPA